ncbi:ABC transporter ATP-binding protein [Haloferax sp. Atlit-47N]|uniref:ABC transporter ATP-binding protein n=1 Tax=Haloferax sp. Atlit-47N TaxID=2077199 RepID=UPI000E232B43|nr:ABC transporter ATP-binding protein [Haloferax sp. Atlit-47N]RDZ35700.1 ABC transporter ATP-binding protein [Haloferax sp. Atlit-47N]
MRASPANDGGNDETRHAPVAELRNVEKEFETSRSVLDRLLGDARSAKAVCGASLSINRGETVGVVGESGCGKSTLAKLVTGELTPDGGSVLLDGDTVGGYPTRTGGQLRRIGVVFQNVRESFDSRWSVGRSIAESFGHEQQPDERVDRIDDLLEQVNLDPQVGSRYPSELSGGQLQRVGIARALAHDPELVVLDEPVSGLDVATQATILDLLAELQRRHEIGYLFISHDLGVVRYLADRLAVMYAGEIVERGPARDVFERPSHPYTEALLRAVPSDDSTDPPPEPLPGSPPDLSNRPTGCPFHPRCPHADGQCERQHPEFKRVRTTQSRCHYADELADGTRTNNHGTDGERRPHRSDS